MGSAREENRRKGDAKRVVSDGGRQELRATQLMRKKNKLRQGRETVRRKERGSYRNKKNGCETIKARGGEESPRADFKRDNEKCVS